jgi:hypothetical protein
MSQAADFTKDAYLDGTYLELTGGTWHLQDSAMKARWISRMLEHGKLTDLGSICEIGCGAGGILAALQVKLPPETLLVGYDISPQAHEMSRPFENARCRFVLGDAFGDRERYDLVMAIDVFEHVEDCFDFLRRARVKGRYKIYHVPLDVHASGVMRGANAWDSSGHIHLFTLETALKTVEYAGHRIIDWRLTNGAMELPNRKLRTRATNAARYALGKLASERFVARLLGGFSVLILAE